MSAIVRFVSAALRDPARGLPALLPLVPGLPPGLELPAAVRVADETDTPWLARGAVPSSREIAAGPVLTVVCDAEALPDDDAESDLPFTRMPVVIGYVARDVDAPQLIEAARHVQRAALRAVLAAFPRPVVVVGGGPHPLQVQRPTPRDVARAKAFTPMGDAVAALEQVVAFRALDAWAWNLG